MLKYTSIAIIGLIGGYMLWSGDTQLVGLKYQLLSYGRQAVSHLSSLQEEFRNPPNQSSQTRARTPSDHRQNVPQKSISDHVIAARDEKSKVEPGISLEKSNTNGVGHQQVTVKGQPVDLDRSADPEAEESQVAAQEALQEAVPEETAEAVPEETAEAAQEEKAETAKERTEQPEPEKTEQPADGTEILEDEVWQTHYDYNDAVRTNFDKLTMRGEHLAIDFAKRFMEGPNGSDLEEIVAQVLEEEKKRNQVEAAHAAMKEISEDAAAEFRRVVDILGEDADLNAITWKIRKRFAGPPGTPKSGLRVSESLSRF